MKCRRPAAIHANSICRSVPLTRGDNLRRGHPGTLPPSRQVLCQAQLNEVAISSDVFLF